MSDTKELNYDADVADGDKKFDIDYSSSSGIDSKRDSSDDNCSEIIENPSKVISYNLNSGNMNSEIKEPAGNNPSNTNFESGSIITGASNGGNNARFSVNNVDNEREGNFIDYMGK